MGGEEKKSIKIKYMVVLIGLYRRQWAWHVTKVIFICVQSLDILLSSLVALALIYPEL